ncbi:hypothetical protein CASFOL_013890 [Castilleja foliolosa]|uniref:Transmembrane protein n=1 Tax=Castilleja foliolosa TaxID=1961234 RepID=A0ABD3DQC7_9LAMI
MIYQFSFTSMIIDLFRASLLFVALLSTSYVHFSILLIVTSFLSLNIMLFYKKITSNERLVQATKQLSENYKVIKHDKEIRIGNEEEEEEEEYNVFTNDTAAQQPVDCDQVNEKGDTNGKTFDQLSLISSINMGSSVSLNLGDELISEDVEEDYLIDISLPELGVSFEEMKRHKIGDEFLDFVSDVNEISGEEDSLIEIDISMGLIRQPAELRV